MFVGDIHVQFYAFGFDTGFLYVVLSVCPGIAW